MGLVLKYVQTTAAGTLHYRRKVPLADRAKFGSTEWKRFLGNTQREAIAAYPKAHAEFERKLAMARRVQPARPETTTDLDNHIEATARLRQVPAHVTDNDRDVWADSLLAEYPEDPETGEPVGVPEVARLVVNGLRNGDIGPTPEPTFADAKRLYLRERVKGQSSETARTSRVDRVEGFVTTALGGNIALRKIGRAGAREVRDYMLSDRQLTPATAKRYVNDIRAIMTLGIREYELDIANPFANLTITVNTIARQERDPFTEAQLVVVQQQLNQHASVDLQRIFRMLCGTGCRLAEVTGLMVEDVVADAPLPYINLVFNEHRRLKNTASIRRVPLMGDALKAAKEAKKAAGSSVMLFPAYGKERGGDNASSALMRHLREVIAERKVTVHSTRHTMEDRMIRAEVDEYDRNLVLGHSRRGQGDRYGSDDARLEATTRALKRTFDHLQGKPPRRRNR